MHRDYLYWIWLSLSFGAGNGGFTEVLEKFGDPYGAYVATERELSEKLGPRSRALPRLLNKDLRKAHEIYDFCVTRGVSILTYGDAAYPARLRTIQDPPILLYYLGSLPAFNRRLCLGVVGTRKMSEYGKRMAYKISYELASAKAVVVSGMALGCDAVAAAGAIAAEGTTVAVLGSGIDVVYPRQHLKLMECIKEHGAVMTEYPPGTSPSGHHFPVRNRIISGLCQGTLAVEGNRSSGALLTVGHAVKQGRKVFAVPGNVGEAGASGTNELIRNGATVVLEGGDILDAFDSTADRELIDFDGYRQATIRSSLNEAVLLRLGITSRLSEQGAAEETGETLSEIPQMGERKRNPANALFSRRSAASEETPRPEKRRTKKVSEDAPKQEKATAGEARGKKEAPTAGDDSEQVLSGLSERERAIFSEMPIDQAIPPDRLGGLGYDIGEIMAGLTILEIVGLITSLPGGLYLKK